MAEKIDSDIRKSAEFIADVRPYTFEEAMRLPVTIFFAVMAEAEQSERERVERAKNKDFS